MEQLLASAKLFVQDKVACGDPTPVEDLFALHVYTMQCSVFAQSNLAMRSIHWEGIRLWRPFLFYLSRALKGQGARQSVVFRGLYFSTNTEMKAFPKADKGSVADFLDGLWPRRDDDGAPGAGNGREAARLRSVSANSRYHVGSTVLWPAFSSTTENPAIALGYGTSELEAHPHHSAVILKIFTKGVCPIRNFSYYPFEEELLYAPNTCFRVKALMDPTSYNLRKGTAAEKSEAFSVSTDHLASTSLELEDARRRQVLLIEMHEESLPSDHVLLDEASWGDE